MAAVHNASAPQAEFDKLYTWYLLHMAHRDTSDYLGYYGW